MGIVGSDVDCHILFPAVVLGAFGCCRDGETVVYRVGRISGVKLDFSLDADNCVR